MGCLPVRFQTLIIRGSNPIPSGSVATVDPANLLTRHKQKVACGVSPFRHVEHSITDPQPMFMVFHGFKSMSYIMVYVLNHVQSTQGSSQDVSYLIF
jgi:hypothetical protein